MLRKLAIALAFVQGVIVGYVAWFIGMIVFTIMLIVLSPIVFFVGLFRGDLRDLRSDDVLPLIKHLATFPVMWWFRDSAYGVRYPPKMLPRWVIKLRGADLKTPSGEADFPILPVGGRFATMNVIGNEYIFALCRFQDDAIALKLRHGGSIHRLRWYHIDPHSSSVREYLLRQEYGFKLLWLPSPVARVASALFGLRPARELPVP